MNIGKAAEASGISTKMIRHYESTGLIPPAARSASGYRDYGAADIHRLRFIRRARDLGFSGTEIADLLGLWGDQSRHSSEVKAIARAHIETLQARIRSLQEMTDTLEDLAAACHGDHRPDCPILNRLESDAPDEDLTLRPRRGAVRG